MKKALGHLTVALVFGASWLFLAGQLLAPERDMTTVVLALVLVVGLYLSVGGLCALLEPLGRMVLGRQPRRRREPGLLASTSSFANASAAGDRVRPAG